MKQTIADTHSLNVTSIAAHPSNAGTIFTGSRDYSVKGWDIETALCKCEYKAERNIVTVMEFDPVDPNLLYQGSEDLSVRVWDIRQSSQQPAFHMTGYVYFPLCMDIHKDGFMMATGCRGFNFVGCEVKLWDLRNTSKFLSEFKGHGQDVNSCKFLHDDKVLLSASKDGSVIAWDIHSLHRKSSKSVAASSITGKELPYTDSKESMSSKNSDNTRTNFAQVQTSGKNITSMAVFDAIPGKFSNDSTGTSNKYTTASKKIPVALSTTDGSLVFLSMDLSGDDGERSGHKVNAGFEVELVTPEYYDVESENASINVTQG